MEALPEILTLKQACEVLNCHPNTLRKWDAKGILPAIRFGSRGDRRYKRADILKLLEKKQRNMGQTDLKHKAKIDAIMNAYLSKLAGLKKKRNQIVSDFLDVLAQKRIKQIRDSLR